VHEHKAIYMVLNKIFISAENIKLISYSSIGILLKTNDRDFDELEIFPTS